MDFRLDEEQELIVSMIKRFADKELRTWSADADREGSPPEELFALGAKLGFFVDAVPEARGGLLEGDYCHLNRALRGLELGRGCAGLSGLLECNVEAALAVSRWASEELETSIHGALVDGALISLAHDFRGRLELTASSAPTLSGSLGPIPGGARAEHLLLLANNSAGQAVVALIPKSLATVSDVTPSGWRAGAWATWSFEATALASEHILSMGEGAGEAQQEILSWARVSLAARAIGVATAAIEHAEEYGNDRVQFGQPIGNFESLIRMRDHNETAIRAGRLLVCEAAAQIDRGSPGAADLASRARDLAADIVTRATIDAVQIFGGYGFVNDYPVEKLMRDARAFEVLLGNEAFARVLQRRSAQA